MYGERDLIIFIASYPWVLQGLIYIISLLVLFFGDLLDEILRELVIQRWKMVHLEFVLEIFDLHSWRVEGMGSLVKHHEHDYCAGPNIDGFGVGGLAEHFGGHVEKGSALGFDIFVGVYL
jgi:hypothetical protein